MTSLKHLTTNPGPLVKLRANFPFTPTLSLRERERPQPISLQTGARGMFERRAVIFPLPEGEGWGEGEQAYGLLTTDY